MRYLHVILANHCIAHGHVYFCMTEELLHLLNGHALVNRACGERTAELAWVDAADVGRAVQLAHARLDVADAHAPRLALERDEEPRAVVGSGGQIFGQVQLGAGVEVDGTLLVALARDDALALLKVDVGYIEPHQLAHAHAGGGQHVYNGEVAGARAAVAQALHLLVCEHLLENLRHLDAVDAPPGLLTT